MIYWSEFSWEAFATLATGLAAVCAAWWIGRKQTKIQNAQVELQELTLRAQLFDRRYRLYESTRAFLLKSFTIGNEEALNFSVDWVQDFNRAMQESRILFSPDVFKGMDEIWRKAVEFDGLKEEMARIYREHGHYGEGNPARKSEALVWGMNRLQTLPGLFEQLNLSSLASPST